MSERDEELERRVRQTREEVARDVREVSARLSLEHLEKEAKMATIQAGERAVERAKKATLEGFHHAKDAVEQQARRAGRAAKTAGRSAKHEVADNPIAYGLIAAGAGWIACDKLMAVEHAPSRRPFALGAAMFALGGALGLLVPIARRRLRREEPIDAAIAGEVAEAAADRPYADDFPAGSITP